jgi:hypothetical protein
MKERRKKHQPINHDDRRNNPGRYPDDYFTPSDIIGTALAVAAIESAFNGGDTPSPASETFGGFQGGESGGAGAGGSWSDSGSSSSSSDSYSSSSDSSSSYSDSSSSSFDSGSSGSDSGSSF